MRDLHVSLACNAGVHHEQPPVSEHPDGRINDLAISERGFVFDPYTGLTYSVNLAGLTILNAIKAGRGSNEIETALREALDVPQNADLQRDISEFVGQLRAQGMLSKDFELR